MPRRTLREGLAARIPVVGWLARKFAAVAVLRSGRLPIGLLLLLPVAVLIDVADAFDEALPFVGTAGTFIVESAFVLGLTGRASWAFGFAAVDVIPGLDTFLPVATLTVLLALVRAASSEAPRASEGAVVEGVIVDRS